MYVVLRFLRAGVDAVVRRAFFRSVGGGFRDGRRLLFARTAALLYDGRTRLRIYGIFREIVRNVRFFRIFVHFIVRFGRLCRRCLRGVDIGRERALRLSVCLCGAFLREVLPQRAGGVLSRTVLRAHGGGARFLFGGMPLLFGGMACGALRLYRRLPFRRLVGKRALRAGFRRRRFFRGLPQSLFARFGREHARFRVRVLLAECGVQFFVILAGAVLALEIGAQRVVVKRGEYARVALAVEVTENVLVLAVETQSAALAEEGYPVAFVQVLHGVRDDHYRAPLAGKFLEQIHHLQVEVGGESAGRLVEEDDLRVGEQFHGYGNAFALSAGEGGYLQIFASGQFHVRDRLFYARPDLFARHFAAHTEHRRVAEAVSTVRSSCIMSFCGT